MIEFVLHVVIEVVCGVTGHFILWAVTLGKWDVVNGRDTEAAVVGLLFWSAVAVGVWFAFFR
ncbi:MAG TPA: hypothetical protein VD866_20440 [Urbifossiella sp.]|nr:hypothetical protein [Urbifossiella sp.]